MFIALPYFDVARKVCVKSPCIQYWYDAYFDEGYYWDYHHRMHTYTFISVIFISENFGLYPYILEYDFT